MSEAYEQIHMQPEDISKTAFATIYGTFMSLVMQQGDCNAATFQRLMTSVFRDLIARFIHVYLDNIFIFSSSVEEHEQHLGQVFDKLQETQLYLSQEKIDLYSERCHELSIFPLSQFTNSDPDNSKSHLRQLQPPSTLVPSALTLDPLHPDGNLAGT